MEKMHLKLAVFLVAAATCVTGLPRPHEGPEGTQSPGIATGTYNLITNGTCQSVSEERCHQLAIQEGFTTFHQPIDLYTRPPGCYKAFDDDGHLYFNVEMKSKIPCTPKRQCYCKEVFPHTGAPATGEEEEYHHHHEEVDHEEVDHEESTMMPEVDHEESTMTPVVIH